MLCEVVGVAQEITLDAGTCDLSWTWLRRQAQFGGWMVCELSSAISLLVNSCLAIFNIWKSVKPVSVPVV